MDGTITIRTSDDPPVELKASRLALAANSRVFADMPSLPAVKDGSDSSIDVAETEAELSPFLHLLDISHDEGDPVKELAVEDWPVAARLADKYDAAGVKAIAAGIGW
mgnify:CR=1 FL=1